MKILKANWDNLIILDACRFDIFRSVNTLEGKLSKINTGACITAEWINTQFEAKLYDNIVYYSGNPWLSDDGFEKILPGLKFNRMYELWQTGLDNNFRTVLPDFVSQSVLETYDLHPDKKKIIHYIQPHAPYINSPGLFPAGVGQPYRLLLEGEVTRKQIIEGYKANLKAVLESVKKILPMLKGKTIITADHGELLGEWDKTLAAAAESLPSKYKRWATAEHGAYGHLPGLYHAALNTVPWFEFDKGIKSKLESLGYA